MSVFIAGTRASQRKVVEKVTLQEEAMALVVDEQNVVDAEELPIQHVRIAVLFVMIGCFLLYQDPRINLWQM